MAISKIIGSGLGTINSPVEFTSADNLTQLTLTSTDADAGEGPNLVFYRNSSSPADNDDLSTIDFIGKNDASQDVTYGQIKTVLLDASDGTEDARLEFYRMIGGTSSPDLQLNSEGVVLNEGSNDRDFRVESNGATYALFVDGGNNHVNIMTSTDLGGVLNVSGNAYIQHADNSDTLTLESTDTDANSGPNLRLYRNSANPADDDFLGTIDFEGRNDNSQDFVATKFFSYATDVSDGSEDAAFQLQMMRAGSIHLAMEIGPTEFCINQGSVDMDFRVESNANTHAIFVNANDENIGFGNQINITQNGMYMHIDANNAHMVIANLDDDDDVPLLKLNRQSADGRLLYFLQANSLEGSVSVSGSTVSYNGFAGRHESSGIPTNTAVGTVLSTIDELDTYPATTKNEALEAMTHPKAGEPRADHAKVKVSDSVGDKRVYGVVNEFDSDGKVYVTSVGISAVKVTGACAGGDLIESNGDGTAKVQSDDIIRSKTIGKVTIGSSSSSVKLVSCVLYCG